MSNEKSEVVQPSLRQIMELRHENPTIHTILSQWLSGDVSWTCEQTLIAMVIALSKNIEEIRLTHINYVLRNPAPVLVSKEMAERLRTSKEALSYDPVENKTES